MKNKKEVIWKDVKGFEGSYKVNSKGEIWRVRFTGCDTFDKVRKLVTKHKVVMLSKPNGMGTGSVEKGFNVKTLIYDCFHKSRKHPINFKDNDPTNLSIDNLYENKGKRMLGMKKFTKKDRKKFCKLLKKGYSANKIGKLYGCSGSTIMNYVNKRTKVRKK